MLRILLIPFLLSIGIAQTQKAPNHDDGFKDTPMLPGLPYHVHDSERPHPPVVTPSNQAGGAPSDAVILFDGKDLNAWQGHPSSITKAGKPGPPEWKIENGYFEVVPKTGDLATKAKFGDIQLHVEWSERADITGASQGRGNTYADGQAGALYGQWPPLANAVRPPGEWNVYDIVFEAPKFEGAKLTKPAYVTVFLNGVLLHNRKESMGPMVYRQVAHYEPQPAEDSLVLQNHNDRVRYRNIWARRISGYDQPEK
jgi:hypothetical protein